MHTTRIGDEGSTVAFCHGVFGQGKNWTSIAKSLAAAPTPHRSILVDMPNHGRSPWTDDPSYPAMADAVAETLRPDGPLALVGHSMGGKAAIQLALRHPDLVDRLCIVDVAPVQYGSMRAFHHYVHGMRTLDLAHLSSRAEADAHLTTDVPDPVVRSFLMQNLRRDHQAESGEQWRWQMNLELIADNMDVLGGWTRPEQPPYEGQVLWIAGAESDYVRPAHADAMRELFPRVRLVTIKNAGHWVHSEQPEVFTRTLQAFLDA
ncbi:alpha/beta fold hydrolase [Mariniluteicoccus endophyticus]